MSGFGGLKRKFHRFPIFQLSNRDHIRRLPEGRAYGLRNARCVTVQLSLMNRGQFVIVQELDRVLNGNDVASLRLVDVIEERREGGRLARSARTRNQDQPITQS